MIKWVNNQVISMCFLVKSNDDDNPFSNVCTRPVNHITTCTAPLAGGWQEVKVGGKGVRFTAPRVTNIPLAPIDDICQHIITVVRHGCLAPGDLTSDRPRPPHADRQLCFWCSPWPHALSSWGLYLLYLLQLSLIVVILWYKPITLWRITGWEK